MSENSFRSIRNGTIASVIAGVILLAIPVFRGYVFGFFNWLWSAAIWCWEALITSYSLPGWVWVVIFILALVGLINIYLALKGESEKSVDKSYVEDFLYGATWRWNWTGHQISDIWCFCPRCDATLVYDDSSCRRFYSDVIKTDFICENCAQSVIATITGGNKDYAISAVMREIDRRLRTGEHKKR